MATYYVDATLGLDIADGSILTPWQTIAKVNASSFSAGDSILFKRGEVWREQLTVPSSGSNGSPITFGAYGSGDDPLLIGSDVQATWTPEAVDGPTDFTADANLQAFWRLNNALTDETANANTLTNNNTVTFDATNKQEGTHAALFTAGNQSLSRADASLSANFPGKNGVTTTNFTCCFWVRFTATPPTGVIIDKAGAGKSWKLQLAATNKIEFTVGMDGATNRIIVANAAAVADTWYHVAGRVDSVTKKVELFINAVKQSSTYTATDTTINVNTNPLRLGFTSSAAAMLLDEVAVFDRALTDAEILSILTNGLDGGAGFTAYHSNTATYATDPKMVFQIDGATVVSLTKQATLGALTVGDWFYDSVNTRVYVRCADDADPATHTIEVCVRDYGVRLFNRSYVTVDGLATTRCKSNGIHVGGTFTDSIIQNCATFLNYLFGIKVSGGTGPIVRLNTASYNGATGIYMNDVSDAFSIDHNIAHHNCQLGLEEDHDYAGGIRFGSATFGSGVIEYNETYEQVGGGFDSGVGIWLDTNPTGGSVCTIRFNESYDNHLHGIMLEQARNNLVYYNLCYSNVGLVTTSGILVTRGSNSNEIYNNVCYANSFGISSWGESGVPARSLDNVIKNNISFGNVVRAFSAKWGGENDGTFGSGNIYDHNCFGVESANFIEWVSGQFKSTYDDWETAYGGTTNSVEADPLFTDAGALDFTLQAGSPCINAGVDVGLTEDFAGNNVGVVPDMGAFESEATPVIAASPVMF